MFDNLEAVKTLPGAVLAWLVRIGDDRQLPGTAG